MNKKGEWLEIAIPPSWEGQSIEAILKQELHVPKKQLHELRMSKGAQLNEEQVPWSKELQHGDKLQVHLFQPEEYDVIPTQKDLEVSFEDDHVLVVNKPAGMNVHPNEAGQKDTLANGVAYHYQQNGLRAKVRHIHRLDQDTTGAVVFAKHPLAGSVMDRMLEQRSIKRTYLCLVEGQLTKKKGAVDKPIGKDRHHPSRRRVSPTGQNAVTHYEVVDHKQKNTSLVKVQLDTGRTHQIRVHMSHIGHPLVGDKLYGSKVKASRQALHAAKVEFPHPISGEQVKCIAPFMEEDLFVGDVSKILD